MALGREPRTGRGQRRAVARRHAEGPIASRRSAAPGYPPARAGRSHARAVDRHLDHGTRGHSGPEARHACCPRARAPGDRRPRGQRAAPERHRVALRDGSSRFRTISKAGSSATPGRQPRTQRLPRPADSSWQGEAPACRRSCRRPRSCRRFPAAPLGSSWRAAAA